VIIRELKISEHGVKKQKTFVERIFDIFILSADIKRENLVALPNIACCLPCWKISQNILARLL